MMKRGTNVGCVERVLPRNAPGARGLGPTTGPPGPPPPLKSAPAPPPRSSANTTVFPPRGAFRGVPLLRTLRLAILLLLAIPSAARAKPTLAGLFGDNMVLQRQMPV